MLVRGEKVGKDSISGCCAAEWMDDPSIEMRESSLGIFGILRDEKHGKVA